jgi:Mrp family chromosome partitioning ATPase
VAALAAGALSLTQPKTYTAQAALQAQSPSQSAGYAGLLEANQQLPTETSAQLQQTATRTDVMRAVQRKLNLHESVDQIRSRITLSQDQQSNFVLVSGTGKTPEAAAAFTNAVANAVAALSNRAIQRQFAALANNERKEAASLIAQFAGKRIGQLTAAQQARYQSDLPEAQTLDQLAAHMAAFSRAVNVAQVASAATIPSSPSSPHTAQDIVIGGVVGLFLGFLLAWLLESLDRRLRRPDETEQLLALPVVGAVEAGNLGPVPSDSGENTARISGFRMIHTNIRFLASPNGGADTREPPRSVLVTSALSEEGKTTVALGIALSSASSGLKTLLIEADVHRPVHAKRLGLAGGPGLADYLRGDVAPGEILQQYRVPDVAQGHSQNGASQNGNRPVLVCITAGNVSALAGGELGSGEFATMLSEVKEVYDLVVVDSAPLLAVADTSEMVPLVDSIAFCARMGAVTVEAARAARAALDRLPKRPTGLVLTDLQRKIGYYYGYSYEYTYSGAEKTPSHA